MSGIIRAPRPARGWTEIQNDTLRDARLTFRARGVLARLLSNADGFRMTAIELAAESPLEGRQAVLAALKNLREAGYVVQKRHQDERGRWRTETFVYDTPQPTEVRSPNPGSTEVRSPDSGSPDSGSPDAGSPDRIRNTSKKKQENKHKKNNPQDKRERGEAPLEGGKPPLSLGGGMKQAADYFSHHGICLQAGNQRDADALRKIERYGEAEIASAVADARARDPQGRAWPTAVLKLLLQAPRQLPRRAAEGPAWARLGSRAPQALGSREIDITGEGETL